MKDFAKLVVYARQELGTGDEYERYRPVSETIRRIKQSLPAAHVVVVAASWCGDCRRQVPRFAKIAERRHAGGRLARHRGAAPEPDPRLTVCWPWRTHAAEPRCTMRPMTRGAGDGELENRLAP